jgi:hypothetical protein
MDSFAKHKIEQIVHFHKPREPVGFEWLEIDRHNVFPYTSIHTFGHQVYFKRSIAEDQFILGGHLN